MIDQGTWAAALGRLQVEMSSGQFAAWLQQSTFVEGGNASLVVGFPNAFAKETVDRNFRPMVKGVVDQIADCDVDLTFVINTEGGPVFPLGTGASQPRPPARDRLTATPVSSQPAPLQPRYTFDNFVAGEGSKLAYAAAKRACEAPGGSCNPLFIHGGVGLGKTHLLRAVGHGIHERFPSLAVRFVTSEDFTHELVTAIRAGSTSAFRARYRSTDVLLMDDVQLIAGRESTQQEVFHTFDSLYSAGKQIVLTSDRPPQTIRPLSDRLITRFAWGLVADIQPPDFETRLAILRSKAAAVQADVPSPVIEFLASSVTDNVRNLEGSLTRVLFFAQCNNLELSVATTQKALRHTGYQASPQPATLLSVTNAVCRHFNLTREEIAGRSRSARLTRPRHIAMYLMREETNHSLPAIGAELGGRDHTTVLHGIRKITRELPKDSALQLAVDSIRTLLQQAAPHFN
ncbi:MAG: chromosomal replication initiator protein DnaA [Chloroflexi bacterium]|nr:chromosomal replication initiator protein DnaA [Chloroflexota bacterium]MCY3938889.1 chromosomal replication initiator protein DnaA [Chloroflexota bacterium]